MTWAKSWHTPRPSASASAARRVDVGRAALVGHRVAHRRDQRVRPSRGRRRRRRPSRERGEPSRRVARSADAREQVEAVERRERRPSSTKRSGVQTSLRAVTTSSLVLLEDVEVVHAVRRSGRRARRPSRRAARCSIANDEQRCPSRCAGLSRSSVYASTIGRVVVEARHVLDAQPHCCCCTSWAVIAATGTRAAREVRLRRAPRRPRLMPASSRAERLAPRRRPRRRRARRTRGRRTSRPSNPVRRALARRRSARRRRAQSTQAVEHRAREVRRERTSSSATGSGSNVVPCRRTYASKALHDLQQRISSSARAGMRRSRRARRRPGSARGRPAPSSAARSRWSPSRMNSYASPCAIVASAAPWKRCAPLRSSLEERVQRRGARAGAARRARAGRAC